MLLAVVAKLLLPTLSCFELMRWNEDNSLLWLGWNSIKTATGSPLSFTSNSSDHRSDVFHALGCYIITAGGSLSRNDDTEDATWLFPAYTDLADGGAASKTSRALKDLIGKVDGLEDDHASHGFRVGPTDELALNHLVPLVAIVHRGGWELS